jgi:hypothetical protein
VVLYTDFSSENRQDALVELATSNISYKQQVWIECDPALSTAISTEMRALRCSTTRMIGSRVNDA